jgi:hypothetical protein
VEFGKFWERLLRRLRRIGRFPLEGGWVGKGKLRPERIIMRNFSDSERGEGERGRGGWGRERARPGHRRLLLLWG